MKNIILLFFLLTVLQVFSQESETQYHLYVKLKQPLNKEDKKTINLIRNYQLSLHRKIEISNLIKGNIYKVVYNLSNDDLPNLINSLKQLDGYVYHDLISATPIKPPHDIAPVTPDFTSNQSYLGPNPGVNAYYAWSVGADGTGINIRNLEYGLNANHEELEHKNAMIAPGVTIHTDATENFTEHGTATAGIIFADNGTYGITGIAHNANEFVLYPEWTLEYDYDRVQAVTNAINNSSAGDVIVFEMQNEDFAPAEVNPLIWDLTKIATNNGIVVVAAAGNGDLDLDDVAYNDYMSLGDSGAIIVGAGQGSINHNISVGTTYGSRVDVQGWSYSHSTGKFSLGAILINNDINQAYGGFTATSAAAAMVGGCVAALQSYYFGLTDNYLTSTEMRNLLIETGIPQGSGNHIGPLPNLKAAIISIDQTLNLSTQNQLNYSIYPNPVLSELIIQQHNMSSYEISVFNIIGVEVFSGNFNQEKTRIDLSFLKGGVYFIKIFNEKGSKTKKIIKS